MSNFRLDDFNFVDAPFVAIAIPEAVRAGSRRTGQTFARLLPGHALGAARGTACDAEIYRRDATKKSRRNKSCLEKYSLACRPIRLNFSGLGFFPNARRPSVLWAGVDAGPELGALAATIENALIPAEISRGNTANSLHT